jgi:hypothetical protein
MAYRPQDQTNQYAFYGQFAVEIGDAIKTLQPGEIFVDVGANCGLWTLPAAGRVGPEGRVIAFIIAFPAAIGPATRWSGITLENLCHSGAGYISSDLFEVPMLDGAIIGTLLDATPLAGRAFAIKIDVEGYELEVLRALEPLLSREELRFVVVECDSDNLKRFGATIADLHAMMHDKGLAPSICEAQDAPKHYDEIFFRSDDLRKRLPK